MKSKESWGYCAEKIEEAEEGQFYGSTSGYYTCGLGEGVGIAKQYVDENFGNEWDVLVKIRTTYQDKLSEQVINTYKRTKGKWGKSRRLYGD